VSCSYPWVSLNKPCRIRVIQFKQGSVMLRTRWGWVCPYSARALPSSIGFSISSAQNLWNCLGIPWLSSNCMTNCLMMRSIHSQALCKAKIQMIHKSYKQPFVLMDLKMRTLNMGLLYRRSYSYKTCQNHPMALWCQRSKREKNDT
jgi:hypothetical protein